MVWSTAFAWFAAVLAATRRPSFEGTDRGDMGTAFGLDDSMAPYDAGASRLDAPTTRPADDWNRRLVRRSHLTADR